MQISCMSQDAALSVRAFLAAAGHGDTDAIRRALVEKVRSVNDDDGAHTTALHRAAAGGHVDTVRG